MERIHTDSFDFAARESKPDHGKKMTDPLYLPHPTNARSRNDAAIGTARESLSRIELAFK